VSKSGIEIDAVFGRESPVRVTRTALVSRLPLVRGVLVFAAKLLSGEMPLLKLLEFRIPTR